MDVRQKILQSGDEQPCIVDGFTLIRRIRFFIDSVLRVFMKEIRVVKVDIVDDTQAISDDAKFLGITEIVINIEMSVIRVNGRMRRHGSVSGFIMIVSFIKMHGFGIKLFDDPVGIFRIVFGNTGFNAGRVKDVH